MKLVRALVALGAAVAMAASMGVQPAQADEPDVYVTPGGQIQGGRLWDTTCSMYSTTTVRCTTKIWATQVTYRAGRYVPVTGWHFNNLTYLPSPRTAWVANPLGAYGQVGGTVTWTSSGRKWRTECDTPATGRGACRSYIWSTYITGRPPYQQKSGWVFNNIVRFAQGGIPPVTTVPAHILDQSRLTMNGLGPLGATNDYATARINNLRFGYVRPAECGPVETEILTSRRISVTGRAYVAVMNTTTKTDKGARVGMTIGEIRALYGASFKVLPKLNYAETQYFGSVRSGNREMLFRVLGAPTGDGSYIYAPDRPLRDSDRVAEISVAPFGNDVSFGGC